MTIYFVLTSIFLIFYEILFRFLASKKIISIPLHPYRKTLVRTGYHHYIRGLLFFVTGIVMFHELLVFFVLLLASVFSVYLGYVFPKKFLIEEGELFTIIFARNEKMLRYVFTNSTLYTSRFGRFPLVGTANVLFLGDVSEKEDELQFRFYYALFPVYTVSLPISSLTPEQKKMLLTRFSKKG